MFDLQKKIPFLIVGLIIILLALIGYFYFRTKAIDLPPFEIAFQSEVPGYSLKVNNKETLRTILLERKLDSLGVYDKNTKRTYLVKRIVFQLVRFPNLPLSTTHKLSNGETSVSTAAGYTINENELIFTIYLNLSSETDKTFLNVQNQDEWLNRQFAEVLVLVSQKANKPVESLTTSDKTQPESWQNVDDLIYTYIQNKTNKDYPLSVSN